jgi:hypothetical protein
MTGPFSRNLHELTSVTFFHSLNTVLLSLMLKEFEYLPTSFIYVVFYVS